MFKYELPELDSLYYIICTWDFYKDLVEENVVVNKLEDDNIWEEIKTAAIENLLKVNKNDKLESVPVKFSNHEEYIRIWMNLFFFECKAQLSRSKIVERDESEKFILNYVKYDEKKKFSTFELIRSVSRNVSYTNGDLILLHKFSIDKVDQKEHTLGIVEKFVFTGNLLIAKIILINNERSLKIAENIVKNSEWFVTRICNLATISREYQALLGIENLKLSELLIHPGENILENYKPLNREDFFYIPKKLDYKLNLFFNRSQYEALKSSIKKKGLTLIQGPPGTGKSTTILGILSVILNSQIKNELSERKMSLIKLVSQEMLNEDKLNCDVDKDTSCRLFMNSHPWLFPDSEETKGKMHNFDDVDFSIDEVFSFKEYPSSKATDHYKILHKPEEDGMMPPEKILVCAPSNVAIDEIVRKMITMGLIDSTGNTYHPKFVRLGQNYHPSLKEYALDYIINQRMGINDTSASSNPQSLNYKEIDKIRHEILSNAKIVCTTLSMAGSQLITSLNIKFDTVVIDESAQAVETSTLIPLKYNCERLILVGDPKQLAATVFSRTALKYNYDQSLFKRFQESGHEVVVLKIQYRMHKQISKFISDTFYNGLLEDDTSIASTTENEECLAHPAFQPFTFFDLESSEEFVNNSFVNEGQIKAIVQLIKQLKIIYNNDIQKIIDRVAIISPYSYQVICIKEALQKIQGFDKEFCIDVNTVDGFQGKEKNIIIFSTVRSKGSKTIGFLSDERRMNVGLSRAKSCLIVIGDSKKLIQDSNWEKLVKYSFRNATFYKIKGKSEEYFQKFEENYKDYLVNNEEKFVKMVYTSK